MREVEYKTIAEQIEQADCGTDTMEADNAEYGPPVMEGQYCRNGNIFEEDCTGCGKCL
jgi:ferredoxin